MKKISLSLATVLILLSSFTANAVLNMGGKTIFTGTLIEVLEPGPDIQAIIDSITDASVDKPYLIRLGPGVYDLGTTGIVMKEWVSIQGSGQEATKIIGAVGTGVRDATSAVMVGVNNTSLTDLTIENTGGSKFSISVYNNNASPLIERVTATATGATDKGINYGFLNDNYSSPIMTNVTARTSFGVTNDNVSIFNTNSSSPIMTNITASASGGNVSVGVFNHLLSDPIMMNVTATGSDGNIGVGVITGASSAVMINVTATGLGGSESYGVSNTNGASNLAFIQNSKLEGSTNGLYIGNVSGPSIYVVNSKIIGGVIDNDTSTTNCRGTYDANLDPVDC